MSGLKNALVGFLTRHPKWLIVIGLLYVLAPVDLIPEVFMGIFGLIDDAVVLTLTVLATQFLRSKTISTDSTPRRNPSSGDPVVETTADDSSRQ